MNWTIKHCGNQNVPLNFTDLIRAKFLMASMKVALSGRRRRGRGSCKLNKVAKSTATALALKHKYQSYATAAAAAGVYFKTPKTIS